MATAPLVTLRGIPSIPKLGDDEDDIDPTKVDRTPPPPPQPMRTPRRTAALSSVPPPRESDVRALSPRASAPPEKRSIPRPAAKAPSVPPPANAQPMPSTPPPLNVRAPMSSCPTEPIDPACIEEVLSRVAAPPPLPSVRPAAPSIDIAAFDARPRALVALLTVAWFVRFAAVAAVRRSVALAKVVFADTTSGARAAWTAGREKSGQR